MNSYPVVQEQAFSVKSGQTIQLQSQQFANTYSRPMYVNELRFQTGFSNNPSSNVVLGGTLQFQLDLGRYTLMHTYVPVWLLYPEWNYQAAVYTLPDATNIQYTYTWRFDRPLLVLPGEFLIPKFRYVDLSPSTTSNVQFSVSSVVTDNMKVPKTRDLPWAAAWLGNVNVGGSTYAEISAPSDLVNSFDEPAHVTAMIGRVMGGTIANNTIGDREYPTPTSSDTSLLTYDNSLTVRMVGSSGRPIMRDQAAWSHAFCAVNKAWPTRAVLPPKGFYIASVDSDLTAVSSSLTVTSQIALTGYRTVSL